jgi:uncharacterized protein
MIEPVPFFRGYGLGLRRPHYAEFVEGRVRVDFVEIISENFMVAGGRPLATLEAVRSHYPVIMHGVSMNIGAAHGLRMDYLTALKALAAKVEPLWVSDHLCWTGAHGFNSHDLLPMPLTQDALDTVCTNIAVAQDVLARELVIENPSTYLTFAADEMREWEFLAEMSKRTGCKLLIDVNNIYVSGTNHGFDPLEYLAGIPEESVAQIHIAGHSQGTYCLIDTHDSPVIAPVWDVYRQAIRHFPDCAVMIERDDNIPELLELLDELDIARAIALDEVSIPVT